jgi:DNA-binding MarR family transcriptional regulator
MPSRGHDVRSQDEIRETGRQHHVGRLLLRANRDFSTRAIQRLHALGYSGVTVAHLSLLPNLDRTGARVTTLATRAGMTKQGMGQLVAELERQGYLTREPDPVDKRAALVCFTASGLALLNDAIFVTRQIEDEYARVLGRKRFADLKQALTDLVEN